jgi:hypothetical protein
MKKGPPERSEGVLLSTARRDNGNWLSTDLVK